MGVGIVKRIVRTALMFFGMMSAWTVATFTVSLAVMWVAFATLGVPISLSHDLQVVTAMVVASIPAGAIVCAGCVYGLGFLTRPLPGSTK